MDDRTESTNVEVLRPGDPTNDTVEFDRLRREVAGLKQSHERLKAQKKDGEGD